jgi:hypothetical protein
MRLSRRHALPALTAGIGGVLLSACGNGAPPAAPAHRAPAGNSIPASSSATVSPADTSSSAAAGPSAGSPRTGGKLRFAMATELDQGIAAARLGNAYTPLVFMMFDTLTA